MGEDVNRDIQCWMKAVFWALAFFVTQAVCAPSSHAQIVALGASVVQGYGVPSGEAFPSQLDAMLRAKGKNYSVSNQGIYGDTTSGVLSRLDSAVPQGTRIVILLIGGNDVRRGGTTEQARAGVNEMVARLKARNIRIINAIPYYRAARGKGIAAGWHSSDRGRATLSRQPVVTLDQLKSATLARMSQRVGANGSRECAPDDRLREMRGHQKTRISLRLSG
jgi:acyl-CoA thioesterase I